MRDHSRWVTPLVGGVIGAAFFLWIAGARVISPTEIGWVMQQDWRIHFLGWHFFRREPWHWPPGVLNGYYHAPAGTAVGFTDSIPLAAFLLKPFTGVLPPTFQYLGLWLLLCFALQGVFGVLLARVWSKRWDVQLLSAGVFVLMPTLLNRMPHPALSAHWLLVWALWIALRDQTNTGRGRVEQFMVGLISGLIHPYLATMTIAIVGSRVFRDSAGAMLALIGVVAGWWASGLFTAIAVEQLTSEGLGKYSMNVLAPLTSTGWSLLLPTLPVGAEGQTFEGFQYFGAGGLLLTSVAAVLAIRNRHAIAWRARLPLIALTALCALWALSPRVTIGNVVVFDVSHLAPEQLAIFRATARFFWPMAYLSFALAIGILVTRLRSRTAVAVIAAAVLLQLIDLSPAHASRRAANRSDWFHAHQLRLTSPLWQTALPHYKHLILLPPPQCGTAPVSFEWPAYLAGLHGVTINAGEFARRDLSKDAAYCAQLGASIDAGDVHDDTIYLVHPEQVARMHASAKHPLKCITIDEIPVCVTARSYEIWG